MKHALKIIIPLVLVVVILASACWFFLSYRPDLTASVLVYWGDRYEASGRYGRAISFYKAAARYAPDDWRIPVALSNAYVKDGNYTKSEYTLVSAITAHPEYPDLYIALSKTYVAQDKLLDAEQMLSRITNDKVKAKLDSLRPSTPVLSPDSGSYTDYISVSVTSKSGTTFLSSSGDFPSMLTDLYTGPVKLQGGETSIIAVTVGDNGLVSDAARAGYTVGHVVEKVTIKDSTLDAYIRQTLNKSSSDDLMSDELWSITELTMPDGVTDLSDLSLFTGLQSLTIRGQAALDFSVLSQLTGLQHLDISGCTLSTAGLDLIGTLPDLTYLDISNCAVTSVNSLVGLTKLTYLNLSDNSISDITALSSMTALQELYLTNNPVKTITYLNNCLALQKLNIENCGVAKLSAVAGNTSLTELDAASNSIEDISVLSGCTALQKLDVTSNQVKDISVLASLPALTTFLGDKNQITAIPKFDAKASELVTFSVNSNKITDLSGLAGIGTLNVVKADYNLVKDVSVLKTCALLVQVDVWNDPLNLTTIKPLEDMSVVVTYNPTYKAK
jgi:hypothetical protein